MKITSEMVEYAEVAAPGKDELMPVDLSDETIEERHRKVLAQMQNRGLDKLVVYVDTEHAGNFYYLAGFFTRFEEALMIIDKSGEIVLMLGNENLNKASKARVKCRAVHVSLFSLPNQPNRNDKSFAELLREAGLDAGQRIGLAGWKHMTSRVDDCAGMYDMPYYIVAAVQELAGDESLVENAIGVFIGEDGVRTTNNANEIAHYEYGASLASDCILDAMDVVEAGVTELELADKLVRYGQHTSVVTIAAAGERFVKANMFPRNKKVQIGDPISLTVAYSGGLSSRASYAVHDASELPEEKKDYIEVMAKPYFAAYATWLEEIKTGMRGGELFAVIEEVLPRADYHWMLCPGHLTAEEEWLSSPVYENSDEELKSGMIFQIDIIPSKSGYAGANAESTVVLADSKLRENIRAEYPEMWARMQRRREYIINELGIALSEDVLPMCSTVGYLRPYLLNKRAVLRKQK